MLLVVIIGLGAVGGRKTETYHSGLRCVNLTKKKAMDTRKFPLNR